MLQEEDSIKVKFSFPKSERLCSKKAIEELIEHNTTFFVYPFKCYYQFVELSDNNSNNQILFSIPKRNFKKAVDRNKIKRRLKEIYRLSKVEHLFNDTTHKNRKVNILIVYVAKDIISYNELKSSMTTLLPKIASVS